MLSGVVQINQDGIAPKAFELPNANALAVAMVDDQGDQLTGFDASRPANAVLSAVPFAAGSQPVLAANPARRGIILYNATNKPVNVALAATASLTVFSFQIPSLGTYENSLNGYTGTVSAIWTATPGGGPSLHVTEITT